MEKAIYIWGLIANESLVRPQNHMAIHPCSADRARESGAFWLFHVKEGIKA
jgi:hypothetical protein